MTVILAIDSGNTRIKWGLCSNGLWSNSGAVLQGDNASLEKVLFSLPAYDFIVISNVAGKAASMLLTKLFANLVIKPHWVSAVAVQCGVHNSYNTPSQLGSDRWASLIAAWHMHSKACVVINVGTTMTVDMLSNSGEFQGGIIMPGPSLMFNSLRDATTLPCTRSGNFIDFPLCTSDAIQTGIVSSLVGAIERILRLNRFKSGDEEPLCIISGGGASVLQPYLNIPIIIEDHLVLDGLVIIANDIISKSK